VNEPSCRKTNLLPSHSEPGAGEKFCVCSRLLVCRSSVCSRDSPRLSSRSRYSIVIEMPCNDWKEMNLPCCSNQSMCRHGWKGGVGEARLVFRIFDLGKASISNNPCSHIRYADAFQGLWGARTIDYKPCKCSTWQMRVGRLALVNCNC